MSKLAWTYLWTVLLCAAVLTVVFQVATPIPAADPATLVVWIVLGIYSQFFEVKYGRHSYYPHLIPFFVAAILLQPVGLALVVGIPHLVEYAKKLYDGKPYIWYIQPFNISSHVLAGLAAQQVYLLLGGSMTTLSLETTLLPTVPAIFVYVVVNHLLIGQILVLARQISWAESGVMNVDDLMTDAIIMSLGYVSALLWTLTPWVLPLMIAPFVMLYRALKTPELEKKANTDNKTGLWNAQHFKQTLQDELWVSEQLGRPFSVIMADLDLLRNLNNTYGHLAGDTVIAGIGKILSDSIRKQDTAARFGGEEYALVLPNLDRAEASAVAEKIRQTIETTAFTCSTVNSPIYTTMSFGVACYPHDANTADKLIYEADIALHQAKVQGRNCVIQATDVPRSIRIEAADEAIAKRATLTDAPVHVAVPVAETPATNSSVPTTEPPHELTTEPAVNGVDSVTKVNKASSSQSIERIDAYTTPDQPPRSLWLFIGGVITTSLIVSGALLMLERDFDWASVLTFGILAFVIQWQQFELYEKSIISSAVATVFAAAVAGGIESVIVSSIVIAVVHYLRMRSQIYKSVFNWSIHLLAGTMPVLLVHYVQNYYDLDLSIRSIWLLMPSAAVAAILYFLIETGLVATAISLTEGIRVRPLWSEQFRWLVKPYLMLSVLGLFLAFGYMLFGLTGVLVFLLPVLSMNNLQKMYVERTQNSVRELRRMNNELGNANQQIAKGKAAIEQQNEELLLTLSRIIDARDPFVLGHASKVTDYARAIAHRLGLPEDEVEVIYQAGLLHDIGKIGVPEAILLKNSPLTDDEYEIVKQHTVLGGEFLSSSHALHHLAPIIAGHHEHWNGKGYPKGLRAEEIPLASRILAVCDAVEAMASDRPYQQSKPVVDILRELERCSGEQFDPTIVQAFIDVVAENPHLISNSAVEVMQARLHAETALHIRQANGWVNGKHQHVARETT
ncbi:diguanylate cyclase [bacterium]|nr:diguanylate cyclase [bacterium]